MTTKKKPVKSAGMREADKLIAEAKRLIATVNKAKAHGFPVPPGTDTLIKQYCNKARELYLNEVSALSARSE
jgi:hypothetical protein